MPKNEKKDIEKQDEVEVIEQKTEEVDVKEAVKVAMKEYKDQLESEKEVEVEVKKADRTSEIKDAVKEAMSSFKTPEVKKTKTKAYNAERISIPATARRIGSLKAFKDEKDAYQSGMWFKAMLGSTPAVQYCQDNGIELKTTQIEGTDSLGGYLVPTVLAATIIELVEKYGVMRPNSSVYKMTSDTLQIPKLLTDLDAYFISEASDKGETNKTFTQVELIARKVAAIVHLSDELLADAVVNLVDMMATNMGRQFAYREDWACLYGTGAINTTSGGITGLITAILAVAGGSASLISTAGTNSLWSEVVMGDFHNVMGTLPEYGYVGDVKWYCSNAFYAQVMQRLAAAAGGNTIQTYQGGFSKSFLGYPVVTTPVMPTTELGDDNPSDYQVDCLFGNMAMATAFGDRQQIAFKVSTDAGDAFEMDETWIRGVERFGFVAHAPGTDLVPGPIIALQV